MTRGLSAEHAELAKALESKPVSCLAEVPGIGPFLRKKSERVDVYRFPEPCVTPNLYAHFKNSEWLLQAGPLGSGPGELTLSIYERALLYRKLPDGGICYHATEVRNQKNIELEGLRIGVDCGQRLRDARFPDAIYYIHASKTLENAIEWCSRLNNREGFVIFPIRIRDAGYHLLADPCGGDDTSFIIETDHVECCYLGQPIVKH